MQNINDKALRRFLNAQDITVNNLILGYLSLLVVLLLMINAYLVINTSFLLKNLLFIERTDITRAIARN